MVDQWLFNSMSGVPSPCVDDWPLPPPVATTTTSTSSEGLDDLPTDSVLADLLRNQSAYTAAAASAHLARPQALDAADLRTTETGRKAVSSETDRRPASETGGRRAPHEAAGTCQPPEVGWSTTTTKRTLEPEESGETSAARRRRSSPCRGCRHRALEMTSSMTSSATSSSSSSSKVHLAVTAATCEDCSTTSSSSTAAAAPADLDLGRLSSALRPDWPGFADVVACGDPSARPLDTASTDAGSSGSDRRSVVVAAESCSTKNSDADQPDPAGVVSSEAGRSHATSRPVILEALLRSSSRLDANKGSSAALVYSNRPASLYKAEPKM